MKFTTTRNVTYRLGIGYVPKKWIEAKNEDHRLAIISYFYEEIKLWDWDICGDQTHDFVFDDGKAYRLEYSWWSEWHHKDEEENGLKDEYTIEKIDIEEANVPEKKTKRDWI
jgi:hypothetical protein